MHNEWHGYSELSSGFTQPLVEMGPSQSLLSCPNILISDFKSKKQDHGCYNAKPET